MDKIGWAKKTLWVRRGQHFTIEVSHHNLGYEDAHTRRGLHRWCVYAYIYPTHPHFANFSGDNMWQEAATDLPLHGGPTLLRWHYRKDENTPAAVATAVQVGADYNHLGDDDYTFISAKDDAGAVFADAEDLFDWLSARKGEGE